MILHMYGLKDRINGYGAPIPFVTETKEQAEELAKRDFMERFQTHTTVHYAPEDFELWYLGNFDTNSGTFVQKKDDIKCIMKGEIFNGNKNNLSVPNRI